MTIIHDNHGNIINAELTIEHERDPDELLILCRALLAERNKSMAKLEAVTAIVGHIDTVEAPDVIASTVEVWNHARDIMDVTGKPYSECRRVLRLTGGDYKQALRMLTNE